MIGIFLGQRFERSRPMDWLVWFPNLLPPDLLFMEMVENRHLPDPNRTIDLSHFGCRCEYEITIVVKGEQACC